MCWRSYLEGATDEAHDNVAVQLHLSYYLGHTP